MITTIVSLGFCITILLIIITNIQSNQLEQLNDSVNNSIEKNNSETKEKFITLANEVSNNLKVNLGSESDALPIEISKEIAARTNVQVKLLNADMEADLKESANALATLLIQVAPSAIVTNNFLALNNYVKSASQNANVVYTVFLKPNGKPLTRYFNKKHPLISGYLKTGKEKKKIDRVLNASKKDELVFLIERSVVVEGQNYGTLLLCISKVYTNQKIHRLTQNFSALNRSVKEKTTSDLGGMLIVISRLSKVINNSITGLNNDADQVSAASGVVLSSSQVLSQGAANQASSIEETGASLEEMAATTKQNGDNAGQANLEREETNHLILKANTAMNKLTTSMDEISEASKETSKIVKTIDEIAFQTNLLALNASVEAARAGEAGAGFAVVAAEVRKLAMGAADAARNTSNLIETTVKKIMDGSQLVNMANDTFSKVSESAKKVGELVGEIAETSEEQSAGIEQINNAVAEVDKVIQQNAANAEASASASAQLNTQSVQMKGYIRDLIIILEGSKAGNQNKERQSVYQVTRMDSSMESQVKEEIPPNRYPISSV
ncbi:MAG: hypothetical protein JEZ12_04125 [Desulfobacterium sp.]|nr:hypothetical protein [Desulfobacterium sp.]